MAYIHTAVAAMAIITKSVTVVAVVTISLFSVDIDVGFADRA